MDFLTKQTNPPARDAAQTQKKAIAQRLAEVIEQNRKGSKEEKLLKSQVNQLFSVGEKCGRITRSSQDRFKPTKALEQYLKEVGLFEAVTVREPKIIKDRLLAHADQDPKLKELYEESLISYDRVELD